MFNLLWEAIIGLIVGALAKFIMPGKDPGGIFITMLIGVAGAGQEIKTRPFQLVTGRVWKGTAFGGAHGRTDVPKIVDWYMEGKINIDDLITHRLPLDRINEGFDLMKKGESIRSVVLY